MTVLAAPRKNVIALVPASRVWAIVCLALAVPMVTVTIALANDKAQAVVVIVGEAVFAAAAHVDLAAGRGVRQPGGGPLRGPYVLGPGATPQSVTSVGIALAAPALTWFQYSRARRMERDLHGELYVTQFGWRKKNRPAYVVRSEPSA